MNALANHGYISRDGITSFAEAANAVSIGYGFDYSLSVFLSAFGLLAGGDLVTGKYTIGGADPRVPNTIGPAGGLDKHGVFEIDGSITRAMEVSPARTPISGTMPTSSFNDGKNTSMKLPRPVDCSIRN